jgi:hypothetical protein
VLVDGVKIYGGFPANATDANNSDLSSRNWKTNKTILSGDLNDDDISGDLSTNKSDNAYHVVIGANVGNTTVLDGFTVSGGGTATAGDWISVNGKTVINYDGGGISNNAASPQLTNLTIDGNQAYFGGGISNSSSSPVLTNVTISGNQANIGGGMFNGDNSSPVLTNVTISGNYAKNYGGGISNYNSSSPVLTNVTISGNQVGIVSGQSGGGGGIFNDANSSPTIINSVIWGNVATYFITSIHTNEYQNIRNYGSGNVPSYSHSFVEGSGGGWDSFGTDGGANIDGNPQFKEWIDPSANGWTPTTGGDYRLQSTSPAINMGDNTSYNKSTSITTDLAGNARIQDCAIDLGAYETDVVVPGVTLSDNASQVVCSGGQVSGVTFSPTVAGTAVTYSWAASGNVSEIFGTTTQSGAGDFPAFNAGTNNTDAPYTATITVTPKIGNCTGAEETFTITVNPVPVVTNPGNKAICNGATLSDINLTGTSSGDVTFSWMVTTGNHAAAGLTSSSGTGNITFGPAVNTGNTPISVTVEITPKITSMNTCTGTKQTFTITVNPTPALSSDLTREMYSGTTFSYTPTSAVGGTTFAWSRAKVDGISQEAANGTGNPNEILDNITTEDKTVTYVYTLTANGCTNTNTQEVKVTVHPVPSISGIENKVICSGGTVPDIPFATTVEGVDVTYDWTTTSDNWSETFTSGTGSATGVTQFDGVTAKANTTSAPRVATIEVTPKIGTSSGTPTTFTITVNPVPVVNATDDQTVCSGGEISGVTFSTNVAGTGATTYDWTATGDWNLIFAENMSNSDAGAFPAFTAKANTGITTLSTTVAVTPKIEITSGVFCYGEAETFDINVNPVPVYPDIRLTVCPGSADVNLSKYIDTVELKTLTWSGIAINETSGVISAIPSADGVFTYKYTAASTNDCSTNTGKVYVDVVKNNKPRFTPRDTVAVCYLQAEALQVNQLFGIESSSGTLSAEPALTTTLSAYYTQSPSSSRHSGAFVFNGKKAYEDSENNGNGTPLPSITYHKVTARKVKFRYTPDDSCFNGAVYEVVVVLTPDISK